MTIKEIRERTGLSQTAFARLYKIPSRSIQNWEQGQRTAPPYLIELLDRAVTYDSIILNKFKDTEKTVDIEVDVPEKVSEILSDETLTKIITIELAKKILEYQDEDIC